MAKMILDLWEVWNDKRIMAFQAISPFKGVLGRRLNLSLGTIIAFVAVDLLLVAASIFALRENLSLRREITGEMQLVAPAKGTIVPQLIGENWTGASEAIGYGRDPRPTLIYSFTVQCGYCEKSWGAMRPLQALPPGRLRIVYIDTNGDTITRRYVARNGIGSSVLLVKLSPKDTVAYDARAVPQLLLVDRFGRVQWSHTGELSPRYVSKAVSLIEHD